MFAYMQNIDTCFLYLLAILVYQYRLLFVRLIWLLYSLHLLKQQGQVEYTPPLQHSIFVSFETCISIDCERFEFLEQNPCQNWCLSFWMSSTLWNDIFFLWHSLHFLPENFLLVYEMANTSSFDKWNLQSCQTNLF